MPDRRHGRPAVHRDDGISVILVEQNVHRALEVTSRLHAIERGAVVFESLPDNKAEQTRLFETIVAA